MFANFLTWGQDMTIAKCRADAVKAGHAVYALFNGMQVGAVAHVKCS